MDPYLVFKTLHLVGAILFLGNIIVTAWWKLMADRTREPRIIAFAQRQVIATDIIFTLSGVTLLAVGGYGSAAALDLPMTTPWIATGHMLFIATGLIWIVGLIPLQIWLARQARAFASSETVPQSYWKGERLWMGFGTLAVILPLVAIPVMVFKVGLLP